MRFSVETLLRNSHQLTVLLGFNRLPVYSCFHLKGVLKIRLASANTTIKSCDPTENGLLFILITTATRLIIVEKREQDNELIWNYKAKQHVIRELAEKNTCDQVWIVQGFVLHLSCSKDIVVIRYIINFPKLFLSV